MMDQDTAERRFLESARRALSPTTQDAERVLSAVDRAIAIEGAEVLDTATPARGTSLLHGLGGGSLRGWLLAAALAAGSGALGYGAGFRAGSRSISPSRGAPSQNLQAPRNSEKEALAGNAREASNPVAPDPPREPLARAVPPRANAPTPNTSAATAQKPDANSLSEEVRMLRRVERALRDQNPRLALALLGDLDKAVPSGQLGEERLAASIQARCALGYGSPAALLEHFAKLHPASAYLTRIRQACGPQPAASPSTQP
ncbi:MAG TPA: hypothetical protein VG937_39910 [Polyangiaceae bacterium]|nr:hypothetical protein [Polyangiaceae bacterium]